MTTQYTGSAIKTLTSPAAVYTPADVANNGRVTAAASLSV